MLALFVSILEISYRIQLRIADNVDNMSVVLFNREVIQFLGKRAEELKEEQLHVCIVYCLDLYMLHNIEFRIKL